MSLFSDKVTPKEVVDQMVRGGVASCRKSASQIGGVFGTKNPNELMLTLLAMDRLTWELAFSRVSGDEINRIREAMGEHYVELLLKELGKSVKAPPNATREDKRLLAMSLARQVRGRAASLGKEWNAHKHDKPGPKYWACRRAVQLMGLDDSNPTYVTRLSARVTPTLVSNTEFIRKVVRKGKIAG